MRKMPQRISLEQTKRREQGMAGQRRTATKAGEGRVQTAAGQVQNKHEMQTRAGTSGSPGRQGRAGKERAAPSKGSASLILRMLMRASRAMPPPQIRTCRPLQRPPATLEASPGRRRRRRRHWQPPVPHAALLWPCRSCARWQGLGRCQREHPQPAGCRAQGLEAERVLKGTSRAPAPGRGGPTGHRQQACCKQREVENRLVAEASVGKDAPPPPPPPPPPLLLLLPLLLPLAAPPNSRCTCDPPVERERLLSPHECQPVCFVARVVQHVVHADGFPDARARQVAGVGDVVPACREACSDGEAVGVRGGQQAAPGRGQGHAVGALRMQRLQRRVMSGQQGDAWPAAACQGRRRGAPPAHLWSQGEASRLCTVGAGRADGVLTCSPPPPPPRNPSRAAHVNSYAKPMA